MSRSQHLNEQIVFFEREQLDSITAYQTALSNVFKYCEQLIEDYPNLELRELDNAKKMTVRWGPTYDFEQLLEHVIVHILRHRQ